MRDLQNVFWEARTRVEKIEEARKRADDYLQQCSQLGALWSLAEIPNPQEPGIFARFCAYPHESLEHVGLDVRTNFARLLRPERRLLIEESLPVPFGDGAVSWQPQPIAHGFDVISSGPSRWIVRDDGTIEVFGFRKAASIEGRAVVHPLWLMTPAAQILAMVEILRREAGKPGVPFELDCTLRSLGAGSHHKDDRMFADQEGRQYLPEPVRIGPFVYTTADSGRVLFGAMEKEIWRGLGISAREPSTFNMEPAISQFQRHMGR